MVVLPDRRSLLLACQQQDRPTLRIPLEDPLFGSWEVGDADSLEQTRYMLQMTPRDVLLLDSALYRDSDPQAMAWITARDETPVLLLGEPEPDVVVGALRKGARQWCLVSWPYGSRTSWRRLCSNLLWWVTSSAKRRQPVTPWKSPAAR
jgi:hypothetical protein